MTSQVLYLHIRRIHLNDLHVLICIVLLTYVFIRAII
nr:MAG TPA: hypothetical protein [Caudoviricetes sp.]